MDFIGYYFISSIIIFKVQAKHDVEVIAKSDALVYLVWTLLHIIFFLSDHYIPSPGRCCPTCALRERQEKHVRENTSEIH